MTNDKHAYLIMAHKTDETLFALLRLTDDERNDIFIHMDVKNKSFQMSEITQKVKYANVYFTPRTDVHWGGYSQIHAEMLLLKTATEQGTYAYYHLLSGQDLPLKSQDELHALLGDCHEEFIAFSNERERFELRTRYYFFWQEKLSRKPPLIIKGIRRVWLILQKCVGVHRNRGIDFYKGANWFSITDDFARYVVSKEEWISRVFRYTRCCDEVFLQTLAMNNETFKAHLHGGADEHEMSMRLIDWTRGRPYVFHEDDFDALRRSDRFFARKFDCDTDGVVVERMVRALGKN